MSAGQEDRRITLSTIHRAKGTEAALVVLAGCEERLLPSWRALETAEQLQEERRLFYVACTRAKDRLYVTHAAMRGGRQTGGPSRFLSEAGTPMSTTRPATTPVAATRLSARRGSPRRPGRCAHALSQSERYTDLRGERYPLAAMSGAEALLVLALLERHAETLHRGELGEQLLHRCRSGRRGTSAGDRGRPAGGLDERGPVAAPDAASPRAQTSAPANENREGRRTTR